MLGGAHLEGAEHLHGRTGCLGVVDQIGRERVRRGARALRRRGEALGHHEPCAAGERVLVATPGQAGGAAREPRVTLAGALHEREEAALAGLARRRAERDGVGLAEVGRAIEWIAHLLGDREGDGVQAHLADRERCGRGALHRAESREIVARFFDRLWRNDRAAALVEARGAARSLGARGVGDVRRRGRRVGRVEVTPCEDKRRVRGERAHRRTRAARTTTRDHVGRDVRAVAGRIAPAHQVEDRVLGRVDGRACEAARASARRRRRRAPRARRARDHGRAPADRDRSRRTVRAPGARSAGDPWCSAPSRTASIAKSAAAARSSGWLAARRAPARSESKPTSALALSREARAACSPLASAASSCQACAGVHGALGDQHAQARGRARRRRGVSLLRCPRRHRTASRRRARPAHATRCCSRRARSGGDRCAAPLRRADPRPAPRGHRDGERLR
jgi:hypothetical protein